MYRLWSNYTDDELRPLLRFANDGYKGCWKQPRR